MESIVSTATTTVASTTTVVPNVPVASTVAGPSTTTLTGVLPKPLLQQQQPLQQQPSPHQPLQQQPLLAQVPLAAWVEGKLKQHEASLLPSLNQMISTAVQSALQQSAMQQQHVLQGLQTLPQPPVLEASTSSSGVLDPAHRLPYLTGNKARAPKRPSATGEPSRTGKMRITSLPPPPPVLPLRPPKRSTDHVDDDMVSLYVSSNEFSQESEGDEPLSASDEEEDESGSRLKSVVVVPDPALPTASVEGEESAAVLNPALQAAFTAATPSAPTSPPIDETLAQQFQKLWFTELVQTRVEEILGSIHPPANATFLRVQPTNEEIFSQVKQQCRDQDKTTQNLQEFLSRSGIAIAQLIDRVNAFAAGETLSAEVKDSLLLDLGNIFMLLSQTNLRLNVQRKNRISRSVPRKFSGIRKAPWAPQSNYLFGDEPHELLSNAKKHFMAYSQQSTSTTATASQQQHRQKNGGSGSKNGGRRNRRGSGKPRGKANGQSRPRKSGGDKPEEP